MSVIYPIGLDIGGSIIKLIYYGPVNCANLPDYVIRDDHLDDIVFPQYALRFALPEYTVHFVKIPIDRINDFFKFAEQLKYSYSTINVTGGGSFKYQQLLQSLPLKFNKCDEIRSLIKGLNYALVNFKDEVFTYGWRDKVATYAPVNEMIYPYLLVNVGSGVSIIRVNGDDSYERVTGTSLGGGTFWGLVKMLTGVTNFDEIEDMSDAGDNKNVDLIVEDIYGGNYEAVGLASYVIASNFGKVGTNTSNHPTNNDVVKALLYMISDNICQIAYLSIKNELSIKNVYFTGSFTNIGPVLWKKLSYGIEFWSDAKIQAKFLKHEGYFGAIGASVL